MSDTVPGSETDFSSVLASILSVEQQYRTTVGGQVQALDRTLQAKETAAALDASSVDELLSTVSHELDAREHQLGVLCILDNVFRRSFNGIKKKPLSPLAAALSRVAHSFLRSSKPGDYMVDGSTGWSRSLCSLCVGLAKVAVAQAKDGEHVDAAKAAILPLCAGLECLTHGDPRRITPLHGELLELCLVTSCYSKAVVLLGADMSISSAVPTLYCPEKYGTKLNDVLRYFYFGGEVFISLKRYAEAIDMFTGAIVMPLFQQQSLVTDALRKYILTCLIVDGELRELPPYASSTIKKSLTQDCAEYMGLVACARDLAHEVDSEANSSVLQGFIQDKQGVWKEDGNEALVAILADELRTKLTLKRFERTYTTVPKDVVMKSLGLTSAAELDAVVLKFAGQVCVRIDDDAGVLHFGASEATVPPMREIMSLIKEAVDMKQAVENDWHEISTSDLFLKPQSTSQGRRGDRIQKGPTGRAHGGKYAVE